MGGKAYIRLSVDLPERKADYPDGARVAFDNVLCFAARQDPRGAFLNETVLRGYLGRRLSRWVPYLIEHGDLVRNGASLYVSGWHEWQEGDQTVADRMRRYRRRKGLVTDDVTPSVTDASVTDRRGNSNGNSNGNNDPPSRVTDDEYVPDVRRSVDTRGDDLPPVHMSFRQRPVDHPERRDPGNPTHWGQHSECLVCGTADPPADTHPNETFEEFQERKRREDPNRGKLGTGKDDPPRDKSTGDGPSSE